MTTMKRITTKEFLENIHRLNNLNLRFGNIIKETKKTITVMLQGRSLGGSYIYEDEQVAGYLTELRIAFNGSVKYIGGDNVYTWGRYVFEFENTYWHTAGKNYSASGYEAFAIGYGETWAVMYRMYRGLVNDKDKLYPLVGLTLNGQDVSYDNRVIFKCLDYKDETHHHFKGHNTDCNRTYFHASFDCYIKESEMMDIYLEINKRVLEHNIKVQGYTHTLLSLNYVDCRDTSPHIVYKFSDDSYNDDFRVGDTLLRPLKEKVTLNRDMNTPLFNIGETFVKDGHTLTITGISYSKSNGFSYGTFHKRGDSSVYSGISQIDLIKIKEPTVTEHKLTKYMDLIDLKFYTNIRILKNKYFEGEYTLKELPQLEKITSISMRDSGEVLIDGYDIDYFLDRCVLGKKGGETYKALSSISKNMIRSIKDDRLNIKNYTEKEKVFGEMFKKNKSILKREIDSMGKSITNNRIKLDMQVKSAIDGLKNIGVAKRTNAKTYQKIQEIING